jgi:hypothetical protein
MHTTAAGAIEALTCLLLLDFVVPVKARSAAHQLCILGCWPQLHSNRGHVKILMRLQKSVPIFNMGVNVMRPDSNFEIKYSITKLTGEEWTRGPGTPPTGKWLVWYTDGSRMQTGNGAGDYGQSSRTVLSIFLKKYTTVFQTEMYAILTIA